ncbi:helix-turn-helix domain-containing protein [Blautia glucerasea]|uniref:helix-turn-helix domain-containing protein n=1 Tax=Blautia glucerasea TaxID=536633 RepID=UPI0015711F89|nr:helix-turn-helix transcriptional regulator [Blautia glucerasea]NSJ27987.1 helix-turn-helix transcriptional regulator [Blautia glucerasea]
MRINSIKLVTEMMKHGINQKELAEMSGVSRVTIGYIKNGKSCSPETLGRIAKALGVDVTEIME